jgi:hypothetical protein
MEVENGTRAILGSESARNAQDSDENEELAERVGVLAHVLAKTNEFNGFAIISRNRNDLAFAVFRRRCRPFAGICRFFYFNDTRNDTRRWRLTENVPTNRHVVSRETDRRDRLWCFHPLRRNLFAFREHHPARLGTPWSLMNQVLELRLEDVRGRNSARVDTSSRLGQRRFGNV